MNRSAKKPAMASLATELAKDGRIARNRYSCSLLSNTKWRLLFGTLKESGIDIRQLIVKFTDLDEEKTMCLPWLQAPHAFADSLEFGPFPFVAIEWVEFPREARLPRKDGLPPKQHNQNIDAIRACIEATGKRFTLQETTGGLRIIGHVR